MRLVTTAIVLAPLMLACMLPALGQSTNGSAPPPPIPMPANNDSASDRDSFTQKAQDQVQEWHQKLNDAGDQAAAKGQQVSDSAKADLNKAWLKTKQASDGLKTAGADGWNGAKATFESASHDLSRTWHKVFPNDN